MLSFFKKKTDPALEADLAEASPEYRVMAKLVETVNDTNEKHSLWSSLFRLILILYLIGVSLMVMGFLDDKASSVQDVPHIGVVELSGPIDASGSASADKLIAGLRSALKHKNSKGVIVRANSPGGSPVQSAYVNDEIYRLKGLYPKKPIYFVITDLCASGCYYMAAAADEIYANKGSIVGSIGVVMNGFGFTGTMEKLGVERRMLTSGQSKGMLDPFSPLKEGDVRHTKTMLSMVHQQFIDVVEKGRGGKLVDDPTLFRGRFWAGEEALRLGLVDGLASTSSLARDKFDSEKLVNYSVQDNRFDKVIDKFAAKVQATVTASPGLRF